jgi:adenylate cyclase class 2
MIEVELKFRMPAGMDIPALAKQLGAKAEPPVEQQDLYFQHPARDFAATDEAFRIRSVGPENVLTYKGPLLDKVSKTRKEIEVGIEPGAAAREEMVAIIVALGFIPRRAVVKVRTEYRLELDGDQVTLAYDQVEGLGDFLELESLAPDDDWAPVRDRLVKFAASLGLSEPERRSYLELLLGRERSK